MATATIAAPTRRFGRNPLAALGRVALLAVAGMGVALVFLQAAIIGFLIPPLAIFAGLSFVVALVMATGWRWTPFLGMAWLGIILAMFLTELSLPTLTDGTLMFAFNWIMNVLLFGGVVVCLLAGVQNYRLPLAERRTPRVLLPLLLTVGALIVGATLTTTLPLPGTLMNISPENLAALPSLTTANFEFAEKEIRVKAGETVTLRLDNLVDAEAHYLDIDELNVHAPIPPGKSSVVVFTPTQPGEYVFYCRPHSNKAAGEGMIGKLIVE